MTRRLLTCSAILSLAMVGLVPATPALAHDRDWDGYDQHQSYHGDRYARRGYDDRAYRSDRSYRGDRGYRYRGNRSRCGNGTTGLIVGGVVGGLLGRAVVGDHGDRTAGLIVGGGAGALAGRAIDKSDDRCRR
jgi:hypothetical protein